MAGFNDDVYKPLSMFEVQSVFYIYLMFTAVAVAVFIGELVVPGRRHFFTAGWLSGQGVHRPWDNVSDSLLTKRRLVRHCLSVLRTPTSVLERDYLRSGRRSRTATVTEYRVRAIGKEHCVRARHEKVRCRRGCRRVLRS